MFSGCLPDQRVRPPFSEHSSGVSLLLKQRANVRSPSSGYAGIVPWVTGHVFPYGGIAQMQTLHDRRATGGADRSSA